MKLMKKLLFSSVILAVSLIQVAADPLLKINIRNFGDLSSAVGRFANEIHPNADLNVEKEFSKGLGLSDLSVIDSKKPWEVVVWYEGGSQPLLAIKAPIADLKKFKEKAGSDGFLSRSEFSWSPLENGLAVAISKGSSQLTDSLTDTEKSALEAWKKAPIKAPRRLIELALQPSDPLRQQIIGVLSFAKMSVLQGLSAQNSALPAGINPAGMQEMMGVYFEVVETWLAGFQDLKLGFDLSAELLTVDKEMTAKPGTSLADWFKKPAGKITEQDLNLLNPAASMSFAGFLGQDSGLRKYIEKLTAVGFTMQNMKQDDGALKEIMALFDKMLPMAFCGSVDMGKTFSFTGSYRFPASKSAENYAAIKRFLKQGIQSMVGEGKLYSSATLVENQSKLNGVAVDRFTMGINLDNPMFSMPGQKEQLQVMYPNGKMEMDQALVGDRLLIASPGKMQELMKQASNAASQKTAVKIADTTCVVGYFNILGFVKQAMAANPMLPEEIKTKFSQLDAQNTTIEFKIDLDNKFQSTGRVPMKLFRELGKLRGN